MSDNNLQNLHKETKTSNENFKSKIKPVRPVSLTTISKKEPWIPPPAKTSKNVKCSLDESCWNLEETQIARNRRYESKISELLRQLETMQEDKISRKNRDLLEESRKALQIQSEELESLKQLLASSQRECCTLKACLERWNAEESTTLLDNVNAADPTTDQMIRALIGVEMNAQSVLTAMRQGNPSLLDQRLSDYSPAVDRLCDLLRNKATRAMDAHKNKQKMDEFTKTINELENLNENLQRQLDDKGTGSSSLQAEVEIKAAMNLRLEQSIKALEDVVKQKCNECDDLQTRLSIESQHNCTLQEDLDRLRRQVGEFKSQRRLKLELLDDEAEQNNERLQHRLECSEERVEQLENMLESRDSVISQLQKQIKQAEERVQEGRQENENLTEEILEANSQVAEMKKHSSLAKGEIDRKSASLERLVDMQSSEVASLQDENQRLRFLLKQCEMKLTDADSEISELRGNLRNYENLIKEYQSDEESNKRRWQEKIKAAKSRAEETERTAEVAESRLIKLESQNKDLLSQLSTTEAELRRRKSPPVSRIVAGDELRSPTTMSAATLMNGVLQFHQEENFIIRQLEAEISRLRVELSHAHLQQDEQERIHLSEVRDLKNQLEQSTITNRGMTTYITFLKRSYANVFGEQTFVNAKTLSTENQRINRDSLFSNLATPHSSLSPC